MYLSGHMQTKEELKELKAFGMNYQCKNGMKNAVVGTIVADHGTSGLEILGALMTDYNLLCAAGKSPKGTQMLTFTPS